MATPPSLTPLAVACSFHLGKALSDVLLATAFFPVMAKDSQNGPKASLPRAFGPVRHDFQAAHSVLT
jgi:hypothetical protein